MRFDRRYLLLALVGCAGLALGGCDGDSVEPESSPGEILEITTESANYGAEDTVVVIVRNKADVDVHLSIRNHVLEYRVEDAWRAALETPEAPSCGPFTTILRPGNSYTAMFGLPEGLAPGQYRYRFDCVTDSETNQLPLDERVSTAFQVTS